jgi:hypothetical protein
MTILVDTSVAVARRRAIEALRSGVPSRDAVAVLGSGQSAIEDKFAELRAAAAAGAPGGLVIGGGFGVGKSHLLEHLARLALDDGFVVSRVVISKETPLHDPAKVFRTAAETALAPERTGPAIAEAAAEIDLDGRAFAELLRWASSTGAGLDERFAATVGQFARLRERDAEFADTIVRFWSGDPIQSSELRRKLRDAGEPAVRFRAVPVRELAMQRLRFTAKLLTVAGYAGWVVLFDEVELIGRYSVQQRAKSYAELARWARGDHGAAGLPIAAVLAMTDDFEAAVITGKNDRELVPAKLRAKETPEAADLASRAELGMRIIDREITLLVPLDSAELDQAYARLREMHGDAFGWEPPDVPGLERLGATRMRQHVRAWINEWDLIRLDPTYRPRTEALTMPSNYREDSDLEGASE